MGRAWRAVVACVALGVAVPAAANAQPANAGANAGANANANANADADANEDTDPTALFRAATDALAGDRPVEAIAKLEALGDRGVIDAVVSYDRGLAYAGRVRAGGEQPGDLGRAAHGFEEARELSHDSALIGDATRALADVRAEVAHRRSRSGDPIELESGLSLGRSIVKLLPENVWAILAALSSLALSVGIVLRAKARVRRLKVAGTTTSAVAAALLVVFSLILAEARNVRLRVREAIVIAPSTRLLDDKHVAMPSLAALPEGARVELLDESSDFAHVQAGRSQGWLPSSTLLPLARR